jgi:hypothetical protein
MVVYGLDSDGEEKKRNKRGNKKSKAWTRWD